VRRPLVTRLAPRTFFSDGFFFFPSGQKWMKMRDEHLLLCFTNLCPYPLVGLFSSSESRSQTIAAGTDDSVPLSCATKHPLRATRDFRQAPQSRIFRPIRGLTWETPFQPIPRYSGPRHDIYSAVAPPPPPPPQGWVARTLEPGRVEAHSALCPGPAIQQARKYLPFWAASVPPATGKRNSNIGQRRYVT